LTFELIYVIINIVRSPEGKNPSSREREFIDKIGGKRDNLSPPEQRGEVAAMKELGQRLGMTGFESEKQERKRFLLEQARVVKQEPAIHFQETSNHLSLEIEKLQAGLQKIETRQPMIYPVEGEDFAATSKRVAAGIKAEVEEIRSKLEQLSFDKSRADEIVMALSERGDTALAAQELERQINQTQRDLTEIERKIAEAEQDVRYKNLMDYSRNARESARQAQEGGWEDLAVVHQDAANLYVKKASELVGLDNLNKDKASQLRGLANLRAMVKNLELYKK